MDKPTKDTSEESESKSELEKNQDATNENKPNNSKLEFLKEFIPLENAKALVRHTISVILVIFCFAFTGMLASWLFPQEPIKTIIHWIELIGIALILVFLLVEFFIEIIKGKGNGKDSE